MFNVNIQHCKNIYTNSNSKKVGIYLHLKTEDNDLQISTPIFDLQKKIEMKRKEIKMFKLRF